MFSRFLNVVVFLALSGCGESIEICQDLHCDPSLRDALIKELPYAKEVIEFSPGPFAGLGSDHYPDIVLGPPEGAGESAGSAHVLSLGVGGSIVLGFAENTCVNGDGPDFVVFENPFWEGGNPEAVYAEPAKVSVSEDGEDWHTFECDSSGEMAGRYPGCAGWTPTRSFDPLQMVPLDPRESGGDAFDLEDLGLEKIRYIKIEDVSASGLPTSAGFDLDAVGLVHYENDK